MNYVNIYGESAIFYALRHENWEFLAEIAAHLEEKGEPSLKISEADTASIKLLLNRSIAGDIPFFEQLFQLPIVFPEEKILAAAIKYNHEWFAENWHDIRKTNALYSA
jgi:hypothetical protein